MGRGKSADASAFWERADAKTEKDFALATGANMRPSTLSSYKAGNRFPRADESVRLARALKTTVEYLVSGDEGAAYVRELVAGEGFGWKPPAKLKELVDDLESLDENRFVSVKSMVHDLADAARKAAHPSNQNGQADVAG